MNRIGSDAEIIGDILRIFNSSTARRLAEMRLAYLVKDFSNMAEIAHQLKSSSRTIGASRLGDICEQLELASRTGDTERIAQCMAELETEILQVQAELDDFLAS